MEWRVVDKNGTPTVKDTAVQFDIIFLTEKVCRQKKFDAEYLQYHEMLFP